MASERTAQVQRAPEGPATESSIASRIADGPLITLIASNLALLVMLAA